MMFRRIGDDVVVGWALTDLFEKGQEYDITDPVMLGQCLADPEWLALEEAPGASPITMPEDAQAVASDEQPVD